MRQSLIQTDGIAIRSLRFARGLGTYQLGEIAGVHGGTVGRIERGERQGSPAVLKKIADALGVSVADITRPVARATKPQHVSRLTPDTHQARGGLPQPPPDPDRTPEVRPSCLSTMVRSRTA